MQIVINDEVKRVIEEILKRGNNAEVYRSKDGVVVAEQIKKIAYRTTQRGE